MERSFKQRKQLNDYMSEYGIKMNTNNDNYKSFKQRKQLQDYKNDIKNESIPEITTVCTQVAIKKPESLLFNYLCYGILLFILLSFMVLYSLILLNLYYLLVR
jgi:hypothetical protein